MCQNERVKDADKCIHCHVCQENCSFLKKYGLDIGDTEKLNKLAYHCFLCGKCSEVCPVGIDGQGIIMDMRRASVASDEGARVNKEYKRTISEKKEYSYRNYRHVTEKSVLFPGCNFPSVYPKTTKVLVELFEKEAGIGVVYDCCGKPIADIGMEVEEEHIMQGIQKRMDDAGVTEVITMCPNCYAFLKPRLTIRVVNIYQKLKELHLGEKCLPGGTMFRPCPDREKGEWLTDIEAFSDAEFQTLEDIQCCGLGGQGCAKEPEIAKSFAETVKKYPQTIYTYCGSCAGNLTRNGCKQVRHVLPEILGTKEKPDTIKSLINRMRTKYL